MNISKRDPRESSLIEMKRYMSGDLESAGRHLRHGLESSRFARGLLKIMGILAVTMVMADGLLTPAQSVLGAVQGIEVVDSGISKGTIIGVTDAILVALFLLQPLGITKITFAFSPIVIVWLAMNAVFGIYNLVHFDAGVFKAFNPGYAFMFLIRHGEEGWRTLGGILLAFTGLEALFADLGAFSQQAIQLSWLLYTFPCLLLAYIGQAAYISVHPEAFDNPFFNAAPPGTIYPALVIAILAAVVASQAIITATFQVCVLFSLMQTNFADLRSAASASHETVLLPPNQSRTHIRDVPWPALYSDRQLAPVHRHCLGCLNIQQHNVPWQRVWNVRNVRNVFRYLHGVVGCSLCLASQPLHRLRAILGYFLDGRRISFLSAD